MKKILSVLLVVLMLASLTVCAFAAGSPSQDTGGGTGVVTPKENEKEKEIEEAEEAEEEAAKAIEEAEAVDEDGGAVIVAVASLPKDATDEMKADFEDLVDELVDAKEALGKDEAAAIPADVKEDAPADAKLVAGQPFRTVASSYPATVTIAVENPDDFVGMMVFENGKWVKLNVTVNDDGTVTFVLDRPAVLSIVSQIVEAA